MRRGFPVTTLARTVDDLALMLAADELVCAVDSALREGWRLEPGSAPGVGRVRAANALADARSESTFETLLRLLLVRGGVAPETLQFEVMKDGRVRFRLDFAWPGLKLAVEADGREYHDAPAALYSDRARANALELAGWTILRFTWKDLLHDPEGVVAQVAAAINRLAGTKRAA
jgi:very-short-patch-repair endonuclease